MVVNLFYIHLTRGIEDSEYEKPLEIGPVGAIYLPYVLGQHRRKCQLYRDEEPQSKLGSDILLSIVFSTRHIPNHPFHLTQPESQATATIL